jgi:hypothetical protein
MKDRPVVGGEKNHISRGIQNVGSAPYTAYPLEKFHAFIRFIGVLQLLNSWRSVRINWLHTWDEVCIRRSHVVHIARRNVVWFVRVHAVAIQRTVSWEYNALCQFLNSYPSSKKRNVSLEEHHAVLPSVLPICALARVWVPFLISTFDH